MAENKLYKFKGYMLSELNTFDELKQAIFYLERKFKWSKKHSK